MSRERDNGWEDHVYVDEDKLVERLKKEFNFINNIHFAGKYDIEDKTLSKVELHTFLWAAYNYCMAVHYVGAGVEPGSVLKRPDYLTINKYKVGYAGRCRSYGRPEKGGTFEISISYKYYEDWGFVQILETLYHEIAHLTYFDHSDEFWAEGERIGFGLRPSGVKGTARYATLATQACQDQASIMYVQIAGHTKDRSQTLIAGLRYQVERNLGCKSASTQDQKSCCNTTNSPANHGAIFYPKLF